MQADLLNLLCVVELSWIHIYLTHPVHCSKKTTRQGVAWQRAAGLYWVQSAVHLFGCLSSIPPSSAPPPLPARRALNKFVIIY